MGSRDQLCLGSARLLSSLQDQSLVQGTSPLVPSRLNKHRLAGQTTQAVLLAVAQAAWHEPALARSSSSSQEFSAAQVLKYAMLVPFSCADRTGGRWGQHLTGTPFYCFDFILLRCAHELRPGCTAGSVSAGPSTAAGGLFQKHEQAGETSNSSSDDPWLAQQFQRGHIPEQPPPPEVC